VAGAGSAVMSGSLGGQHAIAAAEAACRAAAERAAVTGEIGGHSPSAGGAAQVSPCGKLVAGCFHVKAPGEFDMGAGWVRGSVAGYNPQVNPKQSQLKGWTVVNTGGRHHWCARQRHV
jgi:hypothetical protein